MAPPTTPPTTQTVATINKAVRCLFQNVGGDPALVVCCDATASMPLPSTSGPREFCSSSRTTSLSESWLLLAELECNIFYATDHPSNWDGPEGGEWSAEYLGMLRDYIQISRGLPTEGLECGNRSFFGSAVHQLSSPGGGLERWHTRNIVSKSWTLGALISYLVICLCSTLVLCME